MTLKLGIIGLSDGNGHPYSWSAIFNGYNTLEMEECGYPVIPRYLEQQKWPDSQIKEADVIAIWTQDLELSNHIAKATNIENVVNNYTDMIGMVDAVLLARDDAENHLHFAEPFLKAGIPIYIDKPVALSLRDLEKLYSLEQYPGQIFTCSALRYSYELSLNTQEREDLGEILTISAFTPKSWNKYAAHIIEPVLNNILDKKDIPIKCVSAKPINPDSTAGSLIVHWDSGIQTNFFATDNALTPITIRICGTKGWKDLVFTDSFTAFREALQTFVTGILEQTPMSPKSFNTQVVKLIEEGQK